MNIFQSILFPPPPSLLVNGMSIVSLVSLAYSGISEVQGKHLAYSKFWNSKTGSGGGQAIKLSGRAGMVLLYSPALVAALASFFVPGVTAAPRGTLLSAALSIHFFKRVMEVLFVHRFSANVMLESAIPITASYFFNTIFMIYSQYLSADMAKPEIDLTNAGIIIFFIGITGNLYHHYILANLRKEGDKAYKIPKGGLFDLIICPHYLFEIIGLFGICLISQTIYPFCFTFGSMFYLMGRSYATRKWYESKFDNFPSRVKAFLPFIF